jgi:hypothetical protein
LPLTSNNKSRPIILILIMSTITIKPMTNCRQNRHPEAERNPLKDSADDLWSKSTALADELECFRNACRALTQRCSECVNVAQLDEYVEQQGKMESVLARFTLAMRKLATDVVDEIDERGEHSD